MIGQVGIRQSINIGFGLSRLVFGVVASAVPERVGSTWIGEKDASRNTVKTVFRALGFRDIALGFGMTEAAMRDQAGPWLTVALLSDLGDFGATMIARNHLDSRSVLITGFLTGSATVAAAALLAVDRTSD
jgi:hypothetical protein